MQDDNRKSSWCRLLPLGPRALLRMLVFALIWLVLTGFDAASWTFGGPMVLLSTGLSLLLAPSPLPLLSPAGACRFIPFFLRQSTLGGIDVLRRALSPRQLVNPGLVSYSTFLPPGGSRIFFVNTISLLPGTLSADLQEDKILVHTIDKDLPIWANMQNLEWRIAALFSVIPAGRKNHEPDL